MAILITGGAGYIGSHTCIELLNAGYDIIVVDNFSNSKPEALKRVSEITRKYFRTYCLDLQNREGLEKVFTDNEIEAVIHFAGSKAVGESVHFPLKYYENNMNSTITLCEVMKKFNVNKLVFSSSATVYGTTDTVPISEETPLKATNPYGRTKQMIEELLQDLYDSDREWSIALLRYFNPVGAHESGRIGEDPNGIPNNLMPYISQVAIGKLEKLQVFGDDYPTVDGTGVRDYIHVVDLALGHVKALERLLTTSGIDAYNLGTGKGYSVLEVLSAYERAAGKTIPYTVVEKRPGDVAVCYAEISKAKEKLNWEAVKGIDEMCKDAWKWQQHNPFGYEKQSKMLVKN
ncbi:UDP-glucose 4-epimerase GalE [Rossellomorea vietnamensis]|uniref:UDP-glucose 4-epimerase GalE n=1 Tax=Rossellomorea vietnamensis TaxID=218284 RepID=UPI003D28A844